MMLASVLLILSAAARPASFDAPRAARSVHLWYPAPESALFYNEVTVERSTRGSYFMACGFSAGYFGIQELGDGKKVEIFSVWDPGAGNDPAAVPEERRVRLLSKGPGVRAGRFGGEGTGGQSFFDYPWKVGETCRFLVRASAHGDRTVFSAYFYLKHEKRWQPIAAFETAARGSLLKGYYSFIEDFRRDGRSAMEVRRARFGNGWVRTADGAWISLARARFTADDTPTLNIDAGTAGDGFYLANGGTTRMSTPLGSTLSRIPVDVGLPDREPAESGRSGGADRGSPPRRSSVGRAVFHR